jgi:hypothetical protein
MTRRWTPITIAFVVALIAVGSGAGNQAATRAQVASNSTIVTVAAAVAHASPSATPTAKPAPLTPIIVEVGYTTMGSGLSQIAALSLANHYVPTLLVAAPSYAPKGYALRLVHVDPAQDSQTVADAYLQYALNTATVGTKAYPSYVVSYTAGLVNMQYPGLKPQIVTINPGKNGIGVVKGQVIDIKPAHGSEIVQIVWTGLTISYDVTSNVTVSKLTVKALLAVAGSLA